MSLGLCHSVGLSRATSTSNLVGVGLQSPDSGDKSRAAWVLQRRPTCQAWIDHLYSLMIQKRYVCMYCDKPPHSELELHERGGWKQFNQQNTKESKMYGIHNGKKERKKGIERREQKRANMRADELTRAVVGATSRGSGRTCTHAVIRSRFLAWFLAYRR